MDKTNSNNAGLSNAQEGDDLKYLRTVDLIYLRLLKAFNADKIEKRLSPQAQALYIGLLDYYNGLEWPETVRPTPRLLRVVAGLSKKQFERARTELIAAGMINYIPMKTMSDIEGGVYSLTQEW